MNTGISRGLPSINIIPIPESSILRSSKLLDWVVPWWADYWVELVIINIDDWFERSVTKRFFLWDADPVTK